jgi:hypothetical protein
MKFYTGRNKKEREGPPKEERVRLHLPKRVDGWEGLDPYLPPSYRVSPPSLATQNPSNLFLHEFKEAPSLQSSLELRSSGINTTLGSAPLFY